MSYLYFELKEPPEQQQQYMSLLKLHANGVKKSAEYILRSMQLTMGAVQQMPDSYFLGVILLLSRHAAEEIDAVSVLVEKGCISPCQPHLRSAFEAVLGAEYILEAHSEQRALAYLVSDARKRIRWYDKTDPNSQAGGDLRKELRDEKSAQELLSFLPPFDYAGAKNRLVKMLKRRPFDGIDDEWRQTKRQNNGRKPEWHALFGGPKSIRDLAFKLKRGFWYEYLYSEWSNHVHAGNAASKVGKSTSDPNSGDAYLYPLRHPNGIKHVYRLAQLIAVGFGMKIGHRFLSQIGIDDLQRFYLEEIKPLDEQVEPIQITADWH